MTDAPIRPTTYDGQAVKAAHFVSTRVLQSMAAPCDLASLVILKKLRRELEDAGLDPSDYECESQTATDGGFQNIGAWFLLVERTPPT